MVIKPILTIDGQDVSRYLLTAHCEQTANQSKDPGKYDLVLSNIGGRFLGAFTPETEDEYEGYLDTVNLVPKSRVSLKVLNQRRHCENVAPTPAQVVRIFRGDIQKAEADEEFCRIEGSCTEGGMTSGLKQHKTYSPGVTVTYVANDLLDDFGVPRSKRHIYPKNNVLPDKTPEYQIAMDFDTAFDSLAQQAQSIYFFDHDDDFWLVPAAGFRVLQNLTGRILRGSNATTMVGHCNQVNVFGGTLAPDPGAVGSEIYTHNLIHAQATGPEDDIQEYGLVVAPPVYVPNADYKECQKIADNLLQWYLQYKDVPRIKVLGDAPYLLSKVVFQPWNGDPPPINCFNKKPATMNPIIGLVTRRVVDLSADGGFVSTLDVATNSQDAGAYGGDSGGFYRDDKIETKYPGVVFPEDSRISVLLSPAKYSQAMRSAQAKDGSIKYLTLQKDSSLVLLYNPQTGDGKFSHKVSSSESLPGGYLEAYPQVGTNTKLADNIHAIWWKGWPKISGI